MIEQFLHEIMYGLWHPDWTRQVVVIVLSLFIFSVIVGSVYEFVRILLAVYRCVQNFCKRWFP